MNKKYSTEFKLKVVQEYQKGEKGSHILGHEMNIHPSMALSWYHLYKQHGIDGLRTRRTNSPYSEELKKKVQFELRDKASINFLKAKYHLSITFNFKAMEARMWYGKKISYKDYNQGRIKCPAGKT